MKKEFILALSFFALLFYSCGDKKVSYEEKKAYSTHKDAEFTIDYPTHWMSEINMHRVAPFVAYSDNQTVRVATRLIEEVSLDSFVNERIENFEIIYSGFNLISKEVKGDEAIIRYYTVDENAPKIETTMKILKGKEHFYGADCSYDNEAQKDTVEHIISSFKLR